MAIFVSMLKVGMIGSVASMLTHTRSLKNNREVGIIGKSSVGLIGDEESRVLSFPEYNRRELVDAADLLLVDRSSLLLPDLLKLAVRQNKHLYITDFPEITPEQCADLLKLADEAQTVVKIKNPLLCEPVTGYIASHWQEPASLHIFESLPDLPHRNNLLLRYLYYSLSLFNSLPQKMRISGIPQEGDGNFFINIRLDYPSYSTFNIDLLFQAPASRQVRAAFPGTFIDGNGFSGKALLNHREINAMPPADKGAADFTALIGQPDRYRHSDLEKFSTALNLLHELLRKIELYTPWH